MLARTKYVAKVVDPSIPTSDPPISESLATCEVVDPFYLVERWYEAERLKKLYKDEKIPKEILPRDFVTRVRALSKEHPHEIFVVRVLAQESLRRLLQQAGKCLAFAISAACDPEANNTVDVRVYGTGLPRVVDLFDHADYIVVTAESRPGEGLGTHSPTTRPITVPALGGPVNWSVKKAAGPQTHVPPPGLMEILAPHAFSWLEGKRATLMRFDNDLNVRFYRNSYEDGVKKPIIFTSLSALETEVCRGAFAFVADATKELADGRIEIDTACMDIDPAFGTSYRTIRFRILDYLRFLHDVVDVDPFLAHSGSKSYHLRIPVENARAGDWGYVLPRNSAWDTFARRRAAELPALFVGEALEIVTMAYNQWTNLGPVTGREGRHDKRQRASFFFDNRTGVRLGTRVPGSFHTHTGGLARNIAEEEIPATFADLQEAVNVITVLHAIENGDEGIITAPKVPSQTRADNTRQILAFARGFVEESAPWLAEEAVKKTGGDE